MSNENLSLMEKIKCDSANYNSIVLAGENGVGKTTLLKRFYELHPDKTVFIKQNAIFEYQSSLGSILITGKSDEYNFKSFKRTIKCPLNNKRLSNLFERINEIDFTKNIAPIISGQKLEINIDEISSGERELLLNCYLISECCDKNTEYLLIDEPENSLHPIWQKGILNIYINVFKNVIGKEPKLIIATQSEKIIEYALEMNSVEIIKISSNEDFESINKTNLILPVISASEINFKVFNVYSFDFFNTLFSYLESTFNGENYKQTILDDCIVNYTKNDPKYKKEWHVEDHGKTYDYNSLVCYIRNWFHHGVLTQPKPTYDELASGTNLLLDILKSDLEIFWKIKSDPQK